MNLPQHLYILAPYKAGVKLSNELYNFGFMKYKKWSLSEKLTILQEALENGVIETCRKHSLVQELIIYGKRINKNPTKTKL